MNEETTDLLVIGGGINGAGIAADAAGRGLRVILCEAEDLGGATSSWSSKLIHGGLRYLEQYDFKLVREALAEREILLRKAPFLIHPLKFVLPHAPHLRPAWMLSTGLFLYDHLARRKTLGKSAKLTLPGTPEGALLQDTYQLGFTYYDCQTDDARLVVLNAMAARDAGAQIYPHTRVTELKRVETQWQIECINTLTQAPLTIRAKAVVNACGPWVTHLLTDIAHTPTRNQLQWVQGSHIVIRQRTPQQHAYILQNKDKRIVFVLPFERDFLLIGTTDVPYQGDPRQANISQTEIDYLCDSVNAYFKNPITPNDIVWHFSGVRALFDDQSDNPAQTTREYHIEVDDRNHHAPIVSIFGGKLTTYRTLAEHVLTTLKPYFPNLGAPHTAKTYLPGGDLSGKTLDAYIAQCQAQYPWLPAQTCARYVLHYGNNIHALLEGVHALEQMGQHFDADLYAREVIYLMENEWAHTVEDILWRRTKLGLQICESTKTQLAAFMADGN